MAVRSDTGKKTTSVQLSPRDDQILEALCQRHQMSRSDILRRAVRFWAEQTGLADPPKVEKVA